MSWNAPSVIVHGQYISENRSRSVQWEHESEADGQAQGMMGLLRAKNSHKT